MQPIAPSFTLGVRLHAMLSSLGDALLAAFHDRSNRSLFRPEETEFV
jgi:hypothetical protein